MPTAKELIDNIPQELRELRQWVCWDEKKHPRNSLTGANASTDDPSTWGSFDQAFQKAKEKPAIKGVGFVLTESDPYNFIDLDKVIDDERNIEPTAQEIIDKLDSYTEISQSGHGIHIIVRGEKPGTRCRKKNVEIYDRKRYFALTGNIYGGKKTIEDRQEGLEWLCQTTFGEVEGQGEPIITERNLVLDPDANPPTEKLDVLLKDRLFKKTWEQKREFPSLSEYDFSLAGFAKRRTWTDQETADLIIAFRRKAGDDDVLKKALRPDYISRILDKLDTPDDNVLGLLPFKVAKMMQYGIEEPEYKLVLENGTEITMGDTTQLLSPKRAEERLYDADYFLSKSASRKWKEITQALRKIAEIVSTVTREESTKEWLFTFLNTRSMIPMINGEDDFQKIPSILRSQGVVRDSDGRIYLRLFEVTHFAKSQIISVTNKKIANELVGLGFTKMVKNITVKDKRRRITLWVSPKGFYTVSEPDLSDIPSSPQASIDPKLGWVEKICRQHEVSE